MKTSVNLLVLLFQSLSFFLSLRLSFIHDRYKLDRLSNSAPYRNLCERVAVLGHMGRPLWDGYMKYCSKFTVFLRSKEKTYCFCCGKKFRVRTRNGWTRNRNRCSKYNRKPIISSQDNEMTDISWDMLDLCNDLEMHRNASFSFSACIALLIRQSWTRFSCSFFTLLSLNPHSVHLYISELPISFSGTMSPPQHAHFITN